MASDGQGWMGNRSQVEPGTTPYQRIVRAAALQMQSAVSLPMVEDIARRADVESGMAREMFPDTRTLCQAVVQDTIVRLNDHVVQWATKAAPQDPVAQFQAIMLGFLDWSQQNALSSALMYQQNMPQSCQQTYAQYVESFRVLAQSMLSRASAAGRLRAGLTPEEAEFLGRALMMGFMRVLSGTPQERLGSGPDADRTRALAHDAINRYFDMLFPERESQADGRPQA